jgi:hypothetical protein
VVLVWGYETYGDILTLHTYDCNFPGKDDITIQLDISSATPAKTITTNGTDTDHSNTLRGFFQIPYTHQDPAPAYIDDAAVRIESVPARMEPGARADARVVATNTGSTTWSTPGAYRLGSQAPQDNTAWGLGRVDLQPGSVDPELTTSFTFQITAPAAVARHQFCWQMVRDGVAWFGGPSRIAEISVGSDLGICVGLHQHAQSFAAQIRNLRAERDSLDPTDPATKSERGRLAREIQSSEKELQAVEAQQRANGCTPG